MFGFKVWRVQDEGSGFSRSNPSILTINTTPISKFCLKETFTFWESYSYQGSVLKDDAAEGLMNGSNIYLGVQASQVQGSSVKTLKILGSRLEGVSKPSALGLKGQGSSRPRVSGFRVSWLQILELEGSSG